MEAKDYQIVLKGEGVKNDYILGRISGALDAICGLDLTNDCCYAIAEIIEINEETNERQRVSAILRTKTTSDRYEQFKAIVKVWYPKLTLTELKD